MKLVIKKGLLKQNTMSKKIKTESELYDEWLKQFTDDMDFEDYVDKFVSEKKGKVIRDFNDIMQDQDSDRMR